LKELIRPPLKSIQTGDDSNSRIDGILHQVELIQRWAEQVTRVINNLVSNIPDDSTAVDVAGVVADLNSLQDAIKGLDVK
jgi:hypothetical protein